MERDDLIQFLQYFSLKLFLLDLLNYYQRKRKILNKAIDINCKKNRKPGRNPGFDLGI